MATKMSRRTGLLSETRLQRMGDNYRKKDVSDTNISSIKSCQVACYSGKKIIKILWHSSEIFVLKKREKLLFCRHFCKHCFSCSSLIPTKCLYVSTISVAKHSMKRVGLCFLRCFGNKIKNFLVNGSSFSPHD